MGISYNTSTVRDGLVLHLDAANPKSYPGTGTTWNDLSGNGNNGTLVNGVGYSTASNGSMTFDGVNDYASFSIQHSSQLTVNFWVKKESYNTSNPALFSITPATVTSPDVQGSADKCVGGWVTPSGQIWGRIIDTANRNLNPSSLFVLGLNEWANITYVANGINFSVYKNSVYGHNVAYDGNIKTFGKLFIGPHGPEYHNGYISNFCLYNRALTAAEIRQNFECLRGRYGI
jgi:hypothetical protein